MNPLAETAATFFQKVRQSRERSNPVAFSADILEKLGLPLATEPAELVLSTGIVDKGRSLARQDRFEELAALIARHDQARDTTPAGTSVAELLAAGARSDLSRAFYGASDAGALTSKSRVFDGLEMMVDAVCDHTDDPVCAAVLALTHMDAGWAWYRQGWHRGRPETHLAQFREAFARAHALLEPHCALDHDLPLLASARCALLAGTPDATSRVLDDYEDLIDLAPTMPGHMRALGLHLLPCWFGSYAALELEARKTAGRTQDVWGDGAYTWIFLDAALQDGTCFAFLDTDFFLQGIDDILMHNPSQHVANMIAAYLTQMVASSSSAGPDRMQRRALTDRRNRILRESMTEIQPWVWAMMDFGYSTPGQDYLSGDDGTETGTQQAWQAVSTVFAHEMPQKA